METPEKNQKDVLEIKKQQNKTTPHTVTETKNASHEPISRLAMAEERIIP